MYSSQLLLSLSLVAVKVANGYPQAPPGHEQVWKAAAASDSRSPCPALNTAANVGVLPRNGQNITADMLAAAVIELYNIDPSFAKTLAQGANQVAPKGATAIMLADLSKHDIIEHDASLVRNDASQGDNHSVQPALLAALLADAGPSGALTVATLAKSRARREAESKKGGAKALGVQATTLAYGESALLLQALGSPPAGSSASYSAPRKAVEEWMGQEKLPTGYVKPSKPITSSGTTLLAGEILALAKTLGNSSLLIY
ncbi:Cloroperoxidase [Microthyrium microscopicum]|uniref:Cloroperoxidase n=1 Tax=Microthyrium microscopicum TaxID=703497 RepID=A0A6A6UMC1_9PEZI|nr:Cloroperoxidase [Microthyrium microscopicum]